MSDNKFEIFVFSKDKKEDYHFRPRGIEKKAYEILGKTGFERLIEGPLADGRTDVPKCALKHVKNDGVYIYIADLETERNDNFGRPIVISALIYFRGFNTDALKLFINVISGQKIREMTSFFDAVFEKGIEISKFDPKIFEISSLADKDGVNNDNKERLFEYNRETVQTGCQKIIKKYIGSGSADNFIIFSGNYLKMSFFDELNPEICFYKTLIEDRTKKSIISNNIKNYSFIYLLISLLLITAGSAAYIYKGCGSETDSADKPAANKTVSNINSQVSTSEIAVTKSVELIPNTPSEIHLNGPKKGWLY